MGHTGVPPSLCASLAEQPWRPSLQPLCASPAHPLQAPRAYAPADTHPLIFVPFSGPTKHRQKNQHPFRLPLPPTSMPAGPEERVHLSGESQPEGYMKP